MSAHGGGRRRPLVSFVTIIALILVWEVAAHLAPKSMLSDAPIIPSWEFMFGRGLLGISDYWRIPMWAPVPQLGGARTYLGAALAIGYNSLLTLCRVVTGLLLGAVGGIGIGIALSWSESVRKTIALPVHLLRMCPLLALVPLFQFWFGATDLGAVIYVGYGVGVVFLVSSINAIMSISRRYLESAQTLGASKTQVYRYIILPAIWPELFSALFLALGVSWAAVIGAEYIGVQSGIGRIIIWAENFSETGRMMLMTLFVLLYANIGFALCAIVRKRALIWHPALD